MTRWIDGLLGGPARRRRRLERDLRALDRQYADWAGGASPRRRRDHGGLDRTAWLSLGVSVAALAGMVVAVPSLLPSSVRGLVGLGPERLAAGAVASGPGTFAFLDVQPGGSAKPVAYDPCRVIRVQINPDGAPHDGVDLVRDAMADVQDLTGLVLAYDGPTGRRPQWKSVSLPSHLGGAQPQPVLVAWANDDEVPELAGKVVGVGGSVPVTQPDGVVRYVTGGVTLDADAFADMEGRPDGRADMRAIVLHELGHLVGLAHVQDPHELMNSDNLGLHDFGNGDRRGLAALGLGSCG